MSNYEVLSFVNMKTCVILITLSFTQLVFTSHQANFTENDSNSVCPISFFRHKRAFTDYTRWRANIETTPEFLVKIFDEDIPTKKIVAVNIQPMTKTSDKIIIGGVIVPSPTTLSSAADLTRDYTRFVPPTTVTTTRVNGDVFLAPPRPPVLSADSQTAIQVPPKGVLRNQNTFPEIRYAVVEQHAQRDESPPASPQFLVRTPTLITRQYAPITQVLFASRTTITPLTPPQKTHNINEPMRTTAQFKPTRTRSDSEILTLKSFLNNAIPSKYLILTRSTTDKKSGPRRTSVTEDDDVFGNNEFNVNLITEKKYDEFPSTEITNIKTLTYRDSDISYNMLAYNDEDIENTTKKRLEEGYGDYEVKEGKDNDISSEKDSESYEKENTEITESENSTEIVDTSVPDETEEIKLRNASTRKRIDALVLPTTLSSKSIKDKLKEKQFSYCNMNKLRQLNFNSPRTLYEITEQIKHWSEESPIAKRVDITDGNFTTMENPIYMMIIDDPSSGQIVSAKQTVMLIAGIQGRDHHAVTAAMYVLYQLIERSEAHSDLLTKYRFWIIPVFNPDGYDYSTTFPHRREWTKNLRQKWDTCKGRQQEKCEACDKLGLRCTIQPCYGVNLDRNFEYQWIPPEELRSEHPCGELYAGLRQLSEVETQALTRFLHDHRTPLYTFIAFKEGDVLGVMYPYSHTKKRRASDHIYRQRASSAAAAAFTISGRPYVAGQTSEFLPLYAGGIEDWVDGHLGIDNTYTIVMFRPTDSYDSKLITERVVHEAYAAMDTLLLQSAQTLSPSKITLASAPKSSTEKLFSQSKAFLTISIIVLFFS